jgi:hypothetical protein
MRYSFLLLFIMSLSSMNTFGGNTSFSFRSLPKFSSEDHAFHFCKTELNYDAASKAIQITIHIYKDDLETALIKNGFKEPNITKGLINGKLDEYIEAYINKVFIISQESKGVALNWLGKEDSDDKMAYYCYLECPINSTLGQFMVKNNILLEVYKDQKNIVSVAKNRKKIDYFVLDVDNKSKTFIL